MRLSRKQRSTALVVCLTGAIMLWNAGTQASDSLNNQTIELEKPVYFTTLSGEEVLLQPRSYVIAPLTDGLEVNPEGGTSPIQLAITLDAHDLDLSDPMAVSVHGMPGGDSADRHVLALFLPGGLAYEAEGTYSGIRSRAVGPQDRITDPMTIYLEKPVHFPDPGGTSLRSGRDSIPWRVPDKGYGC